MQLGYGNVTKQVKINTSVVKDAYITHNFSDMSDPYYKLVLVEKFWDSKYISLLTRLLLTEGIKNFVICSAVKESVLKDDKTETLISAESNWLSYKAYKDKKADSVIAMGKTLLILNKNGDIDWTFFINTKFIWPRYYCGSEFCNGPDLWVYPTPPMQLVFPLDVSASNPECAYTRMARKQVQFARDMDPFDYSDTDLRSYKIERVDAEHANDVLVSLQNSDLIAFDTETSGFSYKFDKLGTVQLTDDGETAYVFKWGTFDVDLLTKVFTTAKQVVAHNGKFDKHFLLENGVGEFTLTDDTMQLCWVICSDRARGLKPNTILYVGKFAGYDDVLDKIKKKLKLNNYLLIPYNNLSQYAGIDSIVTWRLLRTLEKLCHKIDKAFPNWKAPQNTIYRFYKDIMIPNQEVTVIQEDKGIYHSPEEFENLRNFIEPKLAELHTKLCQELEVSADFDPTSTNLAKLFEQRGWPPIDGKYSSSDEALTEYKRMGYPGIDTLKEWRSWSVGLNTYYKGWTAEAHYEDEYDETGRPVKVYKCHAKYNTFSVCSFRHSCNSPNYQQIPAGSRIAKNVRRTFATPPSEEYWEADGYDNIEYQKVLTQNGSKYFWQLTEEDVISGYDESTKRPVPFTWYKA